MVDLLPCPFCGSNDLETEDGGKFIQCKTPGCGGKQAFFRFAQWQNRAFLPDDQLKIAYAQFEASLKAEREKGPSSLESKAFAEIVKIYDGRNWPETTLADFRVDFHGLITLIREYKERK